MTLVDFVSIIRQNAQRYMVMKIHMTFYIAVAAVFTVSLILALVLASLVFRIAFSIPASLSLLGFLYQIYRDRVNHDRRLEVQRKEHLYNLGVASHMAAKAFDKHVEFCETYVSKMQEGLQLLSKEGPTREIVNIARSLYDIRIKYMPWITDDILNGLLPYEHALRELGANQHAVDLYEKRDSVTGTMSIERKQFLDKVWNLFRNILDIHGKGEINEEEKNTAHDNVIVHLQKVLGIDDLTKLRQRIIAELVGNE